MYCVIIIQWGGIRKEGKIFNVKENIGDKRNEVGRHKKNQKNKVNKLKWTLTRTRRKIPEDKQAAKAAMEHAKEQERVHTAHDYIHLLSDSLSSSSSDYLSETSSYD